MKIRTLIVDDELPICSEIEYLLQFHLDIEVLGKFDKSQDALEYIAKNKCDLVFMDVEMPGMTGLELAECIGTMESKPLIVFVTAYEEYAVPAFATPAVGYITKPVTQVKLTKVLCKVRGLLPNIRKEPQKAQEINRVTVFKKGKLCPLSKQEIIMAYVKDKDVFVRTADGEYMLPMNLKSWKKCFVLRLFCVSIDSILLICIFITLKFKRKSPQVVRHWRLCVVSITTDYH